MMPAGPPAHASASEPGPGHPALREEIGDIRDLMGRLEMAANRTFGDAGLFRQPAAPEPLPTPPARILDQREPVELSVWSPRETRRFLRTLLRLRASRHSGTAAVDAEGAGREAIAAGIAQWLADDDRVYAAARGDDYRLAAETAAAVIDANGSAALEAAIAANAVARPDIVVAAVGAADAAPTGRRDAFELAARQRLPILFVGEAAPDDRTEIRLESKPDSTVGRLAAGHALETAQVDGDDVIAVSEAAGELVHLVRCGDGPAYLEAVTRSASLPEAQNRDRSATDPIERLRSAMFARGDIDAARLADIAAEIAHG